MDRMITQARLLLGAAALLALLVVPVALAASDGPSGAQATASGVKGKVKKLTQRVDQLQQQVAALQGEQGGGRPPSGGAGGDLTGAYPNPTIAGGAVNSATVADGSLTGGDIDESTLFNDNSLTTGDIDESTLFNDNSLTGGDVDESTLGTVPSATNANTANTASTANALNSETVPTVPYGANSFNYDEDAAGADTAVVASFDGLVLIADCLAGPNVTLTATPPGATNSYLNTTTTTTGAVADSSVDTSFNATTADLLPTGDGSGTILYRNGDDVTEAPSNNVTTVALAYEELPGSGTAGDCQLMGTLFGGGP